MRIIALIVLLSSVCFGNYSIYFKGIKLGVIYSFDSLPKHFIKIKVTNYAARLLLGNKKYVVYYTDEAKIEHNAKRTKYKEDRYHVLDIIEKSINRTLKEERLMVSKEKYIQIKKQNNHFTFEYISKGKVKSKGEIKSQNNTFYSLIDTKNGIKIVKN